MPLKYETHVVPPLLNDSSGNDQGDHFRQQEGDKVYTTSYRTMTVDSLKIKRQEEHILGAN
jgi:hypothetical protein